MRKSADIVDLCCGHGLVGMLFAVFERKVERVVLVDQRKPASFPAIWQAMCKAAPWVAKKVTFVEKSLAQVSSDGSLNQSAVSAERRLNLLEHERRSTLAKVYREVCQRKGQGQGRKSMMH